jgi:hypothetical protein
MLISLRSRGNDVVARAYESQGGRARAIGCAMAGTGREVAALVGLSFRARRQELDAACPELRRCEQQSLHPVIGPWVLRQVVDRSHGGNGLLRDGAEKLGGSDSRGA